MRGQIFSHMHQCVLMALSVWRNQGVTPSPSLPGWWMERNENFLSWIEPSSASRHLLSIPAFRLPPGRSSPSRNLPKPRHRLLLKEPIIDLLCQAMTTPIRLWRDREEASWGECAGRGEKPDEALFRTRTDWKFFREMTLLLSTASQPSLWFIRLDSSSDNKKTGLGVGLSSEA